MVLKFEKSFIIPMFVIISLVITCASQVVSGRSMHEPSIVAKHEQWMAQHGRTYKDELEKAMRLKIFKQNLEYIEKANKEGNRTYKLGTNEFSDLTNEEFRASYTGYNRPVPSLSRQSSRPSTFKYQNVTDVPTSIDWRKKGAVTHIKNQGNCGSCWAFSAVAAVEGITQITGGKLIELSEQQLVDCSTDNNGCSGGLMDKAFEYIIENKGLATEADYPYQQEQGTCDEQKEKAAAATIGKYEDLPKGDEHALLQAVTKQPVSVFEASGQAFRFYERGVLNAECGNNCDHGVAVVGFGTAEEEDGANYWLIKNSWGETWGESGYIRILRDEGLCGIATEASYPVAM
ncbi:cysteine proteinase [Citrus sinensis]|nr:cysteine proteinase [Citrus sinensis]